MANCVKIAYVKYVIRILYESNEDYNFTGVTIDKYQFIPFSDFAMGSSMIIVFFIIVGEQENY